MRANSSSGLERTNMMVVDDNRMMLKLMKAVLGALGVLDTRLVATGAEALSQLRARPADIVFVDLLMEPMGGLELIRAIRDERTSPDPFVPIIVVSAFTEEHRVAQARDVGANEFIAKPLSIEGVARRIEECVLRPRPFIRGKVYFGPDRRRRIEEFSGQERRAAAERAEGAIFGRHELDTLIHV